MINTLGGVKGLIQTLSTLASKLDFTRLKFVGMATAITVLVKAIYDIYKNWDKMSPSEKVISSILAAASAIAILAVAVGSFLVRQWLLLLSCNCSRNCCIHYSI